MAGNWDSEVDVLVVGSGAGGMTAAITAADNHGDVLIIEKGPLYGGTTASSGGVLWIPASHLARAAGQEDTPDEAFTYIRTLAGEDGDEKLIRAFVDNAPSMLEYMDRETELEYASIPYTDYHAEYPGGKMGWRSHDPAPLDGRRLGDDLDRMQPSHPATMLFGRISWTAADAAPLIARMPGWIKSLTRTLWRYYSDVGQRLKSPRARYLTGGNALIGRLKLSLDDRKIPLWLETRLVELIRENEQVVGAVVEKQGRRMTIHARKAIILAAGGFERNQALREQHLTRSLNADWSGSQINNTGDTLIAARAVGASVTRMDSAWWAPTVRVPGENRARPLFFERSLPGSMIVNQIGKRYMNEAASYHIVGRDMMEANVPEAPTSPSYVIFDAEFKWLYPMGPVMPMFPDFMLSKGAREILVKARTWDEMAAKLNIDPAVLKETVERFNANARRGEDPDFGRGHQAYDRYYGDPKVQPNPNLKPIVKAPFYALPIYPGDIGTNGGLRVDDRARVLDESGQPLRGLYAIGNTAASAMGRSYPGAGATIGPAMTFGYIAARDAMGVN